MPVSYRLRQSGSVPGGSITFNSPGNWTVPAGVRTVSLTGVGGTGNAGNNGNPGNDGNPGTNGEKGQGGTAGNGGVVIIYEF